MKISHGCLLLHCMLTTLPMEWTGDRVIDRRADGGAGTLAAPPSQRAAIPASHPPGACVPLGAPDRCWVVEEARISDMTGRECNPRVYMRLTIRRTKKTTSGGDDTRIGQHRHKNRW